MAQDFKLPDLGEGIHEAQIINVLVKEGDTVTKDQNIMEVETDKAAVELPVPYAGVISKLNVKSGDTVKVGQVLLSVDSAGAGKSAPAAKIEAPAARETQAPAKPAAAPQRPREEVAAAPAARREQPVAEAPSRPAAEAPRSSGGPIPAAPAVRRMAREMGVDLLEVHGTGPGGRIVREDVERYNLQNQDDGRSAAQAPATRPASQPSAEARPARSEAPAQSLPPGAMPMLGSEPLPDFSQWGPVRREKITQMRKAIARQMVKAYLMIPAVTHGDEVDVTDLETFRKEQGEMFAEKGAKLTLTAFMLKAVAGALQQFPQFNSSFDDASGEIVYKDYYHIGVAVDTPRGLMVPVLRDVDRKGLVRISKEMKDLADRAREFKVPVEELRGGTFTVTNVGSLGGTMSTPMINYPEVAILGMGKLEAKPVVRKGEIVIRKMLPLFLTFDHRAVDGADAARFIRTIMSFLENPLNLLLAS